MNDDLTYLRIFISVEEKVSGGNDQEKFIGICYVKWIMRLGKE